MPPKAKTYEQAMQQAHALLAAARLADPDDHFPYRYREVVALLGDPQPMGPGIPDRLDGSQDVSRTVDDYMSLDIAAASRDYIDAQAAYLENPGSVEAAADYAAARDRLVAARLDHRQNRGTGYTVGAAARRAG